MMASVIELRVREERIADGVAGGVALEAVATERNPKAPRNRRVRSRVAKFGHSRHRYVA